MTPSDPESLQLLRGVHVLLVDDDKETVDLLSTILRYSGALVMNAGSARAALRALQTVKPNVVVADLTMPDEDGYWLLREIRNLTPEQGGTIPVVAITGDTRDHGTRRVRTAGFNAFLPKPIEPWDLCRTLASLVDTR
jgi:CheY-like chemotaxis protein